MKEIPQDKKTCQICVYESLNSWEEPCESCRAILKNNFKPDYNKICKLCFNPVEVQGDICFHCSEDEKNTSGIVLNKTSRRERIAAALMSGLFANPNLASISDAACAQMALNGADALINAIDDD